MSKHVDKSFSELKFENDRVCDAYQFEKANKISFKSIKFIVSTRPLELIQMDLFGPTKTKSLGGTRYVYMLVDDFSRYTEFSF